MLQEFQILPGVVKDDTEYQAQGWCVDSDQMRIVRGNFQTKGGWANACIGQTVVGPIRGNHQWADNNGVAYAAMGSWSKLYVQQGDVIFDITPIVAAGALTGAITTTASSQTVSVAYANHGLFPNQVIHLSASAAVGGVQIGLQGTEASGAFWSSNGSAFVNVNHTNHGRSNGDLVTWSGFTTFNGINLNGTYTVIVLDANNYRVQANTTATATGYGGGAPNFIYYNQYSVTPTDANDFTIQVPVAATSTSTGGGTVDYQVELAPGLMDGSGSGGYGTGYYGAGYYGNAVDPENIASFQPRTWSMDNYGSYLIANPLGGTIYCWPPFNPLSYSPPNLSQRAGALTNAPAQVNAILVTNERFLVALGCNAANGDQWSDSVAYATGEVVVFTGNLYVCNVVGGTTPGQSPSTNPSYWEETGPAASGAFDPLLERWTGNIDDITQWQPLIGNLASDNYVTIGTRLIAGKKTTPNGFLAWTDTGCIYHAYTSNPQGLYQPLMEGTGCGLIGPLAAIEKDGRAYWMTPSGDYFEYNGSSVQEMQSACRKYVFDSIDPNQNYKITATFDTAWQGVEWRYPQNATEINAYIRVDLNAQSASEPRAGWSIGTSIFSDCCDKGVFPNPIGYGLNGTVYWLEDGTSADGSPLSRHLYTGWTDLPGGDGKGNHVINCNRFVMDGEQTGSVNVTFQAKKWPRAAPFPAKGPFTFTADVAEQRFRIQGRQMQLQFDFNGTQDYLRLGAIRVDVSEGPMR